MWLELKLPLGNDSVWVIVYQEKRLCLLGVAFMFTRSSIFVCQEYHSCVPGVAFLFARRNMFCLPGV